MITKNCLHCGKEFESYPAHDRKYCSMECSRQVQGLKGERWSKTEEDYIVTNYSEMTAAQIAKHLNRTKAAVDLHIFYILKLRKKGYSQTLECNYCGKQFTRPPSLMGKAWGNFCSRECRGKWISEHIVGESHPNWQGGAQSYNEHWRSMRRKARARAKGKCERCGKTDTENGRRLDTHHKIPIRQFLIPDVAHTKRNLICLCRQCHIKAHHPS